MVRGCFVIYLLFLSSSYLSIFTFASSRKPIPKQVLKQIDEKLSTLNKPAIKTIKSEDGDIIDCVDIYKQPAFDDSAMKNHIIQMKPSWEPVEESETSSWPKNNVTYMHVPSQLWQKSGSCPEGTIPIRRIRRRDLLRASSIRRFGMKPVQAYYDQSNNSSMDKVRTIVINNTVINFAPVPNRSDAVLLTYGYNYIGASGDINIWNPKVDLKGDYTTGQIWLLAGPGEESIEAGWTVNPSLYGDTQSRLFIYWTKDGYKQSGCFDLTCTGFVQVSREIAVGAALSPISSKWTQYYTSIGIFLDTNTSNWWLQHGPNKTNVGYWPAKNLFRYLPYSAIFVQWGGQVYSVAVQKQRNPHTGTAMGSGEFAESLYGYAAFVNHARIVDFSRSSKYPMWIGTHTTEIECYNAYNYREGIVEEPMFFFGGPGRNYHCP